MNRSALVLRAAILLLLLTAIGGTIVGLLPFSTVRTPLDRLSGDGSADAYTESIHRRFQLAGWSGAALAAVGAAVVFRFRRAGEQWLESQQAKWGDDVRRFRRAMRRSLPRSAPYLLAILVVAIAIRIPNHNQPVSFDEAYTFVKYAKWPLPLIVTRYDEPNNHVFHSVLVHLCYRVFGDSPRSLRIPAFACGVLCPLLTFLLARRSFGPLTALCAALLTAVTPQIVFYSVNARGYTITIVLFLLALLAARLALRRNNRCAWLIIVVAMALSVWTLPTMIYAAIGLFSWMLIKQRRRQRPMLPVLVAGAATVAFSVLLYLPIALTLGGDRMGSVSGSYSKPLAQFFTESPAAAWRVVEWFAWKMPEWCQWLIAAGAALAFVFRPARRIIAPAAAASLPIALVLTIQRIEPPERVWIFAAPLVMIASSAGIVRAFKRLPAGWRAVAPIAAAVIISMGIAVSILLTGPVLWSPETAIFPEAQLVTRDLVRIVRDREPVITVTPASSTIIYHAPHEGLDVDVHFMPPGRGYTNDESAVVVTSIGFKQSVSDVLEELNLQEMYDASTAEVIKEYETGVLWRVRKK